MYIVGIRSIAIITDAVVVPRGGQSSGSGGGGGFFLIIDRHLPFSDAAETVQLEE